MNRRGFLRTCLGGVAAVVAAPLAVAAAKPSFRDGLVGVWLFNEGPGRTVQPRMYDRALSADEIARLYRETGYAVPQQSFPPHCMSGTRFIETDGRIYRCVSASEITSYMANPLMAYWEATGQPAGWMSSPVDPQTGNLWLMTNSGPYTVPMPLERA